MKKQPALIFAVAALVLLAGCGGNVVDWAKVTFNQTEIYSRDQQLIKKHIKSVRLYDQLSTVAKFDALWLSDAIRTMYSLHTCRSLGRDEEGTRSFLRRQLSANEYHVVFYVLSLNENPLTTTLPVWTVSLAIDEKRYLPTELKTIELPAEYNLMFDKLLSNHKHSYDIKFDRKDADGKDILQGAKVMKLIFSSAHYFGSVIWYLDENGAVTEPPVVKKEVKERTMRSFERRSSGHTTAPSDEQPGKKRVMGKRMHSHLEQKKGNAYNAGEQKPQQKGLVLQQECLLEGGDSV